MPMGRRRRKRPSSHTGKRNRHSKPTERSEPRRPTARTTDPTDASPKAARRISPRRLWLFRLIAVVVIPVLLLGATELVLRLVGYGFAPEAIAEFEMDGQVYAGQNNRFSWRFFPPHLAREPSPYVFPAAKTDQTCRIFVLGASAAMGVPEPTFCFGRMLREMLADRYPGVHFEVITTAMAAINSHAVLPIARDCARYHPDLFVVYLGNNEVTGPYGAGSVFAPLSGNLSLIRASIAVRGTRLGQLMGKTFGSLGKKSQTPRMWRGLEMFQNNQVRADDAGLQTVYKHYRSNLEDILAAGRNVDASVVLCTVGANLKDNPPFGSLHRPDLSEEKSKQWDAIYRQGVAHEGAGRYAEAIQEYLHAAEIDDTYADLQFRLGRCYWTMEQYDQAADRYAQARRQDTLRFRVDDRINKIVRDVAAQAGDGVFLADAVEAFGRESPHGVAGQELFYEHVHLNFSGNYLLARTVLDRVERALPERFKSKRSDKTEVLSEQACARRLAYTPWNRYKIADKVLNSFLKRPPFSDRLYHKALIEQLEGELATLRTAITPESIRQAAQQHLWALEQDPDDWVLHWKYGQLLVERLNNYGGAIEQFRWVCAHLPHAWLPYESLGRSLQMVGDMDGAVAQYEKVIELQPTNGRAHFYLGEVLQARGDVTGAEARYRSAVKWEPNCIPAYNNLARILAGKDKLNEAIEVCRRGLVFAPRSATLHGSLGTLLARTGQIQEAVRELQTALDIDPNSTPVRKSLELLLKARAR